ATGAAATRAASSNGVRVRAAGQGVRAAHQAVRQR
ncbi:MAG: hypothetical protein JWN32_938, partial [Solirubrobacterales bacterium]|nr:hypothetical protein [Solirubrobacterales bacterium]